MPQDELPQYSGLVDPSGVERLGCALARLAASTGADTVLVWEPPEDLVLAHVVARELGATVARACETAGIVHMMDALPAGARVLLLGDAFRRPAVLKGMTTVTRHHGAHVVGAAVLIETAALAELGDLPVFSLLPIPADDGADLS
ncbi:hypothetical protein ETD86_17770 [Nonomuraea turkmeniaca]|uniref:Uncharacterized protein n=1 Tax=Nonomuraea turkmeniaca TaxID=103838 RepID=A0A5S4FJC7_9ACTN|nr:hypothetical protein [Nonomuraea turkmeniaca]TMR20733.1 hypothetical protein ETD86_17770 [Nonomuraea turkmeniaca]